MCVRVSFFFFPQESLLFLREWEWRWRSNSYSIDKKERNPGRVKLQFLNWRNLDKKILPELSLSAQIKPIILCDVLDKASKFSAFDYFVGIRNLENLINTFFYVFDFQVLPS